MASIQHVVIDHAVTSAQGIATRGKVHRLPDETAGLTAMCNWDSGSSGTKATVYIQTSFDNQTTWTDIMAFAFASADAVKYLSVREETAVVADHVSTTGALTDDTAVSGIIGQHIRAQIVTTGTYSGGANMNVRVRIENGNN